MSKSASPRSGSATSSVISSLNNSEKSRSPISISRIPSTKSNRSSVSSHSTRRSRELPNSIVLFVKAHGLDLTKTSFVRNLAMRFEELEIDDDPLSVAENNVKLTLGTDRINYAYGYYFDRDRRHGIGMLEEPIIDILFSLVGHGDKESGKRILPSQDVEKLLSYLYERRLFTLRDIRHVDPDVLRDVLIDICEPGFVSFPFDRERIKVGLRGLCETISLKYEAMLHFNNDIEMIGINQLVTYFCLGNKQITNQAYNHNRKLLKQQTDNFYTEQFGDAKRCHKILEEFDRRAAEEDEEEEKKGIPSFSEETNALIREHSIMLLMKKYRCFVFNETNSVDFQQFRKSKKYLDYAIKRKTTDRFLQLHKNKDESDGLRKYGIYIIKAQLNGETYCSKDEPEPVKSISDLFKDTVIIFTKGNYRYKITAEQWRLLEEEVIRSGINTVDDLIVYTFRRFDNQVVFSMDGKDRLYSIFDPITTDRNASEIILINIMTVLTTYTQAEDNNKYLLLSYSNPFIKRIVDAMPEGQRKTFIMKFFTKTSVEFSNVVAVCKALGFDHTFTFDPCCRSPCIDFSRRLDSLGIPYLYGILKQIGLETEEKIVELLYEDYEEKKKQLIYVYHTITKDPLMVSLFDNRVIPFLDEVRIEYFAGMDEDDPVRSPLEAMQPRSRSIASPILHKPKFVQKSRYRPDDVVDFHVPGKRANVFRRGKIVSGTKAEGYTIRCFDPTCGNLSESTGVYENVPYLDIVQYEDLGDYVDG